MAKIDLRGRNKVKLSPVSLAAFRSAHRLVTIGCRTGRVRGMLSHGFSFLNSLPGRGGVLLLGTFLPHLTSRERPTGAPLSRCFLSLCGFPFSDLMVVPIAQEPSLGS